MVRKSNFEFVYDRDSKERQELFEFLYKLESDVKINPYRIGNGIRQVLEILCAMKIESDEIKENVKKANKNRIPDLNSMLNILRKTTVTCDGKTIHLGIKPLPSQKLIEKHIDFDQKTEESDKKKYLFVDNFLRQIGNEYSHNSNPFVEPVFLKTYKNVLLAMRSLHKYLWEYFGNDLRKLPEFREDIMPIGNYEIVETKTPNDSTQGYCLKEYTAKRHEDYQNDRVGFSVIRQYRRVKEEKQEFLKRASDVYMAGDNCGPLLKQVSILSNENSQYYIVAYDFRVEARPINAEFLQKLPLKEKIQLCLSYAEILKAFHANVPKIFHRMLTSNCAYYADERARGRGITTAIIKFEFAKITEGAGATILPYVNERLERLSNEERRFLPEKMSNRTGDEIDIYSLGVLFCDILMGQIGGYGNTDKPDVDPCRDILRKMESFQYKNMSDVYLDLRGIIEKMN